MDSFIPKYGWMAMEKSLDFPNYIKPNLDLP
jgi:hypothetical protein